MAKNFSGSVANIIKQSADKTNSINQPKIQEIDLALIDVNADNLFNIDQDSVEFECLIESIIRVGVLQPIILKKEKDNGRYKIIAGHRRYLGSKKAQKSTIPAIIREYDENNENFKLDETLDLIETNLSARVLTIDDIQSTIKALEEIIKEKNVKGNTAEYIGKILNMSSRQVKRYKSISNAIPEIKDRVNKGELSMSAAAGFSALTKEQQKTASNVLDKIGSPVSREIAKKIKSDIEKTESLVPELKQKLYKGEIELDTATKIAKLPEQQQAKILEVTDKQDITDAAEAIIETHEQETTQSITTSDAEYKNKETDDLKHDIIETPIEETNKNIVIPDMGDQNSLLKEEETELKEIAKRIEIYLDPEFLIKELEKLKNKADKIISMLKK